MNFVIIIFVFAHFCQVSSLNLHCIYDIVKDTESIQGLDSFIEKNYRDRNFFEIFTVYRCTSRNLTSLKQKEIIESVTGDHIGNLTNVDVKWWSIKDSIVNYLPSGIKNFMPAISFLMISGIHLSQLTMEDLMEFPRLKYIWAANNDLVALNSDLFSRHVTIYVMDFSNNKLMYLDKNALLKRSTDFADFRNNDCMDRDIDYSVDYPFASRYHKSCLFPNEIFVSFKKVKANYTATVEDGMEYEGVEKTKIRHMQKRFYEDLHVNRIVRKISSKSLNFTVIPKIICKEFKSLEELEIVGSLIEKISKEEIQNFVRLKILRMPYNLIKTLPSDTFMFNENLEIIDLSYNRIEAIGYGTFSRLPNLQSLTLHSTACIDGVGSKNASNLEIFLENIQEKCRLDDVILCKFSTSNFRYIGYTYYCNIVRRKINNPDMIHAKKFFAAFLRDDFEILSRLEKFNGVFGEHLAGKSNLNVEVLSVKYDESRLIDRFLSFHLPNLKTIKIVHSKLRYLYEDTFHGLQNLTVVDLSHNHLTEIPKKIFEQNKNIIYVDFSYNNLKRIFIESFNNFNKDGILKLAGNPCITTKTMSINLKFIDSDLNKCNVSEMELLCNEGIKISNYDCYVTQIEQISDILPVRKVHNIKDVLKVKDLVIDYALIEYLPTNISSFFPNIKEYCAYGIIKKIVKGNFEKLLYLERVDLSKNMIEFIDQDVFEDNRKIEQLFLNFNRIKSIPSNTFKHLTNLRNFEIKENACANVYLQHISTNETQRRLEVIENICGASLPHDFKRVGRTVTYY